MDIFSHGSYLIITIVLILTGSGLPVPEEAPIIYAGLLAGAGSLNPWIALACCIFGAIVGDSIMYWIGYHFGRGVLRDHPWFARWVTPEREDQIEAMFKHHGLKVFFVTRFLVGLRSPVYLTAGILQVSFKRFFMIDLFCATMVVSTFFGITYKFGQNGQVILKWVRKAEVAVSIGVVIAIVGVAFYLWRRYKQKLAAAAAKKTDIPQATQDTAPPSPPPTDSEQP
jgi:membrane protein DedA with SNARE-associated domain